MHNPHRSNRILRAALCLAPLLLAACGGGGGDDAAPPSLPQPEVVAGPDPLLPQQWHLENTGQNGGTAGQDLRAKAAWAQTKGEAVRVTVIDDAVQTDHEDLAPNVAAAGLWNYRQGSASPPLPAGADETHGTAVAGIIAARDGNSVGGAGVAPRVALGAYNALATSTNADIADALNRELASTAIYHNSWGSADDGTLNRAEQSFVNAIRNGVANGRSGLGAVYVFPSGNGGCYLSSNTGCNNDNSNYDGYVNQFGVITACAVDNDGRAPVYAEPGANVLVCGPSGNTSTGITTTTAPSGYIGNFSGTSASAPMVSGVAALLLAARPDLSWRDVRLILANSARKSDPGHPGWEAGAGGGRDFNHLYCFGAADAQAALALATNWTSVGGSSTLQSCEVPANAAAFPIAIPDAPASGAPQVRENAIAVSCPITRIEYVEIGFSAANASGVADRFTGDLRIELVSPTGTMSRLADSRLCESSLDSDSVPDSCGLYQDWRFTSVRHLDEPASGTWTLRVSDRINQDSGTWTGWHLRFWGR